MTRAALDLPHVFEPAQVHGPPYTALLLHGTGADEHDLLPLGRQLAPSMALLSPRGPVAEGGANRWFRRLREGVFDEEDVRKRARELVTFIDDAAEAYDFHRSRVVAIGFSNGANIASAVHLLHPGALAGSILLRPMAPLEPDATPDLAGAEILMVSGREDPLVRREDAEHLRDMYEAAGASVTHHWTDAGHGLTHEDIQTARMWLAERFERAPPPRTTDRAAGSYRSGPKERP